MSDMEAPVCFDFKNSIYKRKGYYRKLVFVLLVFAYLASVCATLVLRLRNFSLNGKGKLHNEGTKRVRRDTGLELEPLTAGKLHVHVYIKILDSCPVANGPRPLGFLTNLCSYRE